MRLVLWSLMFVLLTACASQTDQPVAEQNARELRSDLTSKHPSAYLYLADELFSRGDKDQAAVMFYVGQIRYRAFINTLTAANATEQEAQYEQLKTQVGEDINQYAARNLDHWIELLDEAVEWHEQHPNEFLPKEDYSLLYELTLYNFNRLREYIVENKTLIRAQRAKQGLPNE